MTKQDALKIWAVLRVNYDQLRTLTKTDAEAKANLWAVQFAHMPYDDVFKAVQVYMCQNKYPPVVSDIMGMLTGENNENPALRYPQRCYLPGEIEAMVYNPLEDPEFLKEMEQDGTHIGAGVPKIDTAGEQKQIRE